MTYDGFNCPNIPVVKIKLKKKIATRKKKKNKYICKKKKKKKILQVENVFNIPNLREHHSLAYLKPTTEDLHCPTIG